MTRSWRSHVAALGISWLFVLPPAFAQAPAAPPADAASAKTWMDRRDEIETYLKTAAIVEMEELKTGVTRPRRAHLAPGGPVGSLAWKLVPPGRPYGYWESYKSEIAAYELDKLLGLDMVPPTVEKRVKGDLGAAVMWCSPTQSFKQLGGVPTPPPAHATRWARQLVRAKMFDNLIGNKDPNLGNWLVDPAWNLILIDHTRAFATDRELVHRNMDHLDAELWARMQALTADGLMRALQPWVGKREIDAILGRRERMKKIFDELIAKKGEAEVVLR